MTEAEARQRIAEVENRIRYNNHTMSGCTDAGCRGCAAMERENTRLRAYLDSLKGST